MQIHENIKFECFLKQIRCEMQVKWGSLTGLWFLIATSFLITEVLAEKVPLQSGGGKHDNVFTSSFLVRFRRSVDNLEAHKIAEEHGFENVGPVSTIFSETKTKNIKM